MVKNSRPINRYQSTEPSEEFTVHLDKKKETERGRKSEFLSTVSNWKFSVSYIRRIFRPLYLSFILNSSSSTSRSCLKDESQDECLIKIVFFFLMEIQIQEIIIVVLVKG